MAITTGDDTVKITCPVLTSKRNVFTRRFPTSALLTTIMSFAPFLRSYFSSSPGFTHYLPHILLLPTAGDDYILFNPARQVDERSSDNHSTLQGLTKGFYCRMISSKITSRADNIFEHNLQGMVSLLRRELLCAE